MPDVLPVCSRCGVAAKKARPPRGWKRQEEVYTCAECWAKAYTLRAVTLPVVGPLDGKQWPDLRKVLAAAWADSTSLSNWTMTELAKVDVVRVPGDEKMPKFTVPYLYPAARARFPGMSSQAVAAVLNTVQAKYAQARYEVVWTHSMSLPSFRYPVPYPLPAQAWRAQWLSATERVPVVRVNFGGEGMLLRLRGGAEFRPQLAQFAALVEGRAKACEMAIYRQSTTGSSHRNGVTDHGPKGGGQQLYRVMAKLVMWVPRPVQTALTEDKLVLRRAEDGLIKATVNGTDTWVLNADHVKRWMAEHRVRLHRLSEDEKCELRNPAHERTRINEFRQKVCLKQNRRMETFCHTASMLVAKYAERRRVGGVVYAATGGMTDFPWSQFETFLAYKLQERGITFEKLAPKPAPAEG